MLNRPVSFCFHDWNRIGMLDLGGYIGSHALELWCAALCSLDADDAAHMLLSRIYPALHTRAVMELGRTSGSLSSGHVTDAAYSSGAVRPIVSTTSIVVRTGAKHDGTKGHLNWARYSLAGFPKGEQPFPGRDSFFSMVPCIIQWANYHVLSAPRIFQNWDHFFRIINEESFSFE